MRTIICGSRGVLDQSILPLAIDAIPVKPTVVLCGGAQGADTIGMLWARENNIPVEMYFAEWRVNGEYDKHAGRRRNVVMADNAEQCLALWNGTSRLTAHMIETAAARGMPTYIWRV